MKDNYEGMLFSLNNPVAGGPPGTLKNPEITVPRTTQNPQDLLSLLVIFVTYRNGENKFCSHSLSTDDIDMLVVGVNDFLYNG